MSVSNTKTIPFTEYMLPHGERRPIQVPVSDRTYDAAVHLIMEGLQFEIETLSNGYISATITDAIEEDDLVCIITQPERMQTDIQNMIKDYHYGK